MNHPKLTCWKCGEDLDAVIISDGLKVIGLRVIPCEHCEQNIEQEAAEKAKENILQGVEKMLSDFVDIH